jgi:F-type H+-transporting ATPase subunit alpha
MDNILQKLEEELDAALKTTGKGLNIIGSIIKVDDVIVIADGLDSLAYGEIVMFERTKVIGMALDLNENTTGIIVLGDAQQLKQGDKIIATGKQLSIDVSAEILGRHVDAIGTARDGRPLELKAPKQMLLEKIAPGVIQRKAVDRPLQTGVMAIDAIVPIGRGQRELIVGDRQTGKTAIGIDAIINQKNENVICIYVAIGQKAAKIARIIRTLKKYDAMDYTVVVSASASDPSSMQFIAPYTGVAIGEYFMEQGKDVLIVYDDLSKHAWAYREVSLLLKRPPGREAYPGDIFYLHSRLLERAAQLSVELGGGSITALPIIETQAGDVSAYIPTNVISITDGQIYLEADLFNSGTKPAINVGLSVSRVGGSAQIKAMKQVAGKMRLDLAQYNELAAFAQFGSDLDKDTQKKLDKGARLVEILKQDQYVTLSVAKQVVLLFAATQAENVEKIPVDKIKSWTTDLLQSMNNSYSDVLEKITSEKILSDEIKAKLAEIVKLSIQDYIEK